METLSQPAQTISWYNFPWDIRYEILTHLAEIVDDSDTSRVGYTCVAKEWVPIFERRTFFSLRIRSRDMARFHEAFLVKTRRSYLKYLTFIPDLPQTEPYPRLQIGKDDMDLTEMFYIYRTGTSTECRMGENLAFTKAVASLLGELATWKSSESSLGGIWMEILIEDKSFWQETASKLRQSSGPKAIWGYYAGNPDPELRQLPDAIFNRVLRAADLNFHHLLVLDMGEWDTSAKTIDVVSRLSISRESTRRLDAGSVSHLMKCLPRLKAIEWNIIPFTCWKYENEFYERLCGSVCDWPRSLERIEVRCIRVSYHPLLSSSIDARFRQLSVTGKEAKTIKTEA